MSKNEKDSAFGIDFDAVSKLVDLVKSSKIGRIKVSCGDFEIEVESQKVEGALIKSKLSRSLDDGIVLEAGENELSEIEAEVGMLYIVL